jgi:DNA-binding NarL/FixJ family response regulator
MNVPGRGHLARIPRRGGGNTDEPGAAEAAVVLARWSDMKLIPALEDAAPVVLVAGGAPAARERVAAVLAGGGWASRIAPDPDTLEPADGTLVVLITGEDAAAAVRATVERHPAAHVVAVVAGDLPSGALRRVLVAGAAAIVADDELDSALAVSCGAVAAGQLAVPAAMVRQIAPRPLSHREKQVLGLVIEGCTNREIGDRLFVAESTVKTHLSSVFAKLDAHSRSDVVARVLDPDSGYAASLALAPPTEV